MGKGPLVPTNLHLQPYLALWLVWPHCKMVSSHSLCWSVRNFSHVSCKLACNWRTMCERVFLLQLTLWLNSIFLLFSPSLSPFPSHLFMKWNYKDSGQTRMFHSSWSLTPNHFFPLTLYAVFYIDTVCNQAAYKVHLVFCLNTQYFFY